MPISFDEAKSKYDARITKEHNAFMQLAPYVINMITCHIDERMVENRGNSPISIRYRCGDYSFIHDSNQHTRVFVYQYINYVREELITLYKKVNVQLTFQYVPEYKPNAFAKTFLGSYSKPAYWQITVARL